MAVKPLRFLKKLLPIKKIHLLKSKLHLSGKHLNLRMLGMLFLGAVIPVTILFARTSQDIRQHAHHGDSWSASGSCINAERNIGIITIRSDLAYLSVYEMDVSIDGVNVGKADATGDTVFRKIPDPTDPTNRAKDREITAGTHTIEVVAGDSLPKTAVINCNDVVISSVPSPTPVPASSVKITSPNGGETVKAGDVVRISWEAIGKNAFYLGWTTGPGSFNPILLINNPEARYYDWVVNAGNLPLGQSRQIKIDMLSYPQQGIFTDQSDGFFTVVNPLPTPTQVPTPTPTPIPAPSAILITSPINNSGVKPKSRVAINVSAKDKFGIKRVEFYVNNSRVCTDYTAPYECSWLTPAYKAKARYSLTAKSINKINKTSISNQVYVYGLSK